MLAQAHLTAAWKAYRHGDPAQGVRHAERALAADAEDGEAWYALACNLERSEAYIAADRAFLRAARARYRPQAPPWRVSWARFQRAVRAAVDALPMPLRAALDELTLVLADYPEPYLLEGYEDPELLGIFEGEPRTERGQHSGSLSPRLHLWRRPHEHAADSAAAFDAEIRQTLHHELGHYLGFDEDELERLGMG
ncbi:MAG: metallopeptidase family protein [Planctomycetota bacterium]|nr:metallopeptidase family protein [Planctomycetota bacterium]MCX8039702.1 metallopeptidase family protein [Planctomycetota bacterium]MDW8372882.1 metallopeptidase family protein [Planctomycetota bacterium]